MASVWWLATSEISGWDIFPPELAVKAKLTKAILELLAKRAAAANAALLKQSASVS